MFKLLPLATLLLLFLLAWYYCYCYYYYSGVNGSYDSNSIYWMPVLAMDMPKLLLIVDEFLPLFCAMPLYTDAGFSKAASVWFLFNGF